MQKILDTGFTAITSICTIQLFNNLSDVQAIYSLFVQSLVATAAIGKLMFDVVNKKNEKKGN
jgi:hypothetical protein